MLEAIEKKLNETKIQVDFKDVKQEVAKGANDLDYVYAALDTIMSKAIEQIYHYSIEKNINLRQATYAIAIDRIYKTTLNMSL